MRRKDREITDIDKIETIIASARYMYLGMFDGEFPYIVPLHYGYQMEKGKLTFYVHCAKEGHKLECFKENRNVFVEIDRGESLITADIPCKYGADPPFASTVPPTGSPHILISAVPSDIKNSAVNIFRWNQPTS